MQYIELEKIIIVICVIILIPTLHIFSVFFFILYFLQIYSNYVLITHCIHDLCYSCLSLLPTLFLSLFFLLHSLPSLSVSLRFFFFLFLSSFLFFFSFFIFLLSMYCTQLLIYLVMVSMHIGWKGQQDAKEADRGGGQRI